MEMKAPVFSAYTAHIELSSFYIKLNPALPWGHTLLCVVGGPSAQTCWCSECSAPGDGGWLETPTPNLPGLGRLSKHVSPLLFLLLFHITPSHKPFLEMGWGWSLLWLEPQPPFQTANGLLPAIGFVLVANTLGVYVSLLSISQKVTELCKVECCQKHTKSNPLGDVWNPCWVTWMLCLGALSSCHPPLVTTWSQGAARRSTMCKRKGCHMFIPVFVLKFQFFEGNDHQKRTPSSACVISAGR